MFMIAGWPCPVPSIPVRRLAILLTLAACSGAMPTGEIPSTVETATSIPAADVVPDPGSDPERQPIVVSLSLYVVSNAGATLVCCSERTIGTAPCAPSSPPT